MTEGVDHILSPLTMNALRDAGYVVVKSSDLVGYIADDEGRDARLLQMLESSAAGPCVNVADIVAATCHVGKVRKQHLTGPSRRRPIAMVRQSAMFLAREMTDLSYPQIGRLMGGRDHTTIFHGERAVRNRLDEGEAETTRLIPAIRRRVGFEVRQRMERHV